MEDKHPIINDDSTIEADLILKYIQKLTTPEETLLIENWMNESDENRNEVKQIANLFFTKRAYDRMTSRDTESAYQKIQSHLHKKKNQPLRKILWHVAASFIGAIILSSTYVFLREKELIPGQTNYIIAEANPGMRTCLNLSDGTVVYLNSGSKFIYPEKFNDKNRTVRLDGEAFFQVKKDEKKPFIVNTVDGKASIEVLGTSFNVRCFKNDNEFSTTLVEGLVDITINRNNGIKYKVKLMPNNKIVFDKGTDSLSMSKIEPDIETAWTHDRLIFRNHPMPQVLKTLAYNYNVEFIIKNPAIDTYRFTGTFQSRQLPQILEYLKISSNINYTISYPSSDDSLEIKKTRVILN